MGAFNQIPSADQQHTVQQQPIPQAPVSFGANMPNQAPSGKGNMAGPPPAPRTEFTGKGFAQVNPSAPAAKGGVSNVTYPGQSGQPQMGVPNQYANTVQQPDMMQARPIGASMKGKGA